jgi:hypothetical protein
VNQPVQNPDSGAVQGHICRLKRALRMPEFPFRRDFCAALAGLAGLELDWPVRDEPAN